MMLLSDVGLDEQLTEDADAQATAQACSRSLGGCRALLPRAFAGRGDRRHMPDSSTPKKPESTVSVLWTVNRS